MLSTESISLAPLLVLKLWSLGQVLVVNAIQSSEMRMVMLSHFLGLILAQLLKLNGASRVVIAANKGIKTRVARDLDCGDEYIEIDRLNPEPQWTELKKANPYGFDIVVRRHDAPANSFLDRFSDSQVNMQVEATGSEKVANDAIHYVRRGGTLMLYAVHSPRSIINWPPLKIFGDEIKVCLTYRSSEHMQIHNPDCRFLGTEALFPSCSLVLG